MNLEQQIGNHFGLRNIICEHLNTPTNDVFAVTTPIPLCCCVRAMMLTPLSTNNSTG
jgi:hypothetical protein